MSDEKDCFVICPIGAEGSDVRKRSDKLLEHIIEDALSEFDYRPIRADEISEPGSITAQVIQKTVESELVIADLTNHNPNVFYELAIRHAEGKPYIQLIDSSQSIPFDISDLRTIEYDFDIERAYAAIEEIKEQIEVIEERDTDIDNPISKAANFKAWRESENPEQKNLAEVMAGIQSIQRRIDQIERKTEDSLIEASSVDLKEVVVEKDAENELSKIKLDKSPIEPGSDKK